jgi:hypothetical protein
MPNHAGNTYQDFVWRLRAARASGRTTANVDCAAPARSDDRAAASGAGHPIGAVAQANAERTAAYAARDAAEEARNCAEIARGAAEANCEEAREEVITLQQHVAFFEEQCSSTRALFTEIVEPAIADLREERASLIEEAVILNEELQVWASKGDSPASPPIQARA